MLKIQWPVALATMFLVLLGWYLFYTESIVRALEDNAERLSEIYHEVQAGLATMDQSAAITAMFNLQGIIIESGVPLVITGPGGLATAFENLDFEVDLDSPEGQREILAYTRSLDAAHPPVGDPNVQQIHFGSTPEFESLRRIPWFQAGGMLLTALIGFVVIRSQRRAESEKAWTSMARELAHQLGTPLSSLAGWLEVLSLPVDERPGGLRDREIAGSIGEDLQRLEGISHRFELIGTEPELESLSVRQVVSDLEQYLASRIPKLSRKSVELVVDIPPGLPRVQGNEVLLIWALENVVKNALDALAGRGGKITIYAREIGGKWISLRIRDTGPGVDPEIRDKLFEPGVTTKSSGWGVGLALSRRIVEGVHKGRIELLEGFEGTTFQIRLPAADA
ncbi:MAG TPA: HAMP domain-containing histidine kinase [Gemmatimonadetes bacterium]|nr:HAMP domain-containing histidine kinase [Gemmatimonadota bacterium]